MPKINENVATGFYDEIVKLSQVNRGIAKDLLKGFGKVDSFLQKIQGLKKPPGPFLKIADGETKRRHRRYLSSAAAGVAGAGLGYGAARLLGSQGIKLRPGTAAALSTLAGLTGTGLLYTLGAYANDPAPRLPGSKLPDLGAVQPKDGPVAERHEGHSPEVPPGRVSPTSGGQGHVPLRAGVTGRVGEHGRDQHRADDFRFGNDKYSFGGKETRDYNFKGPVRVR